MLMLEAATSRSKGRRFARSIIASSNTAVPRLFTSVTP
jgi:hypothetical protein